MRTTLYVAFGYISGSVLYARIFTKLFGKENILEKSRDKNPGAANAFLYGGFWCGVLTLLCDLMKGFLPVFLFTRHMPILRPEALELSLVMAAPVIGHVFSIFYRFHGGKGIAVTFGCLLGLLPTWLPVGILIVFFVFFSTILRITPHFYRTWIAYICSLFCMICFVDRRDVWIGFLIITAVVCYRLAMSSEEKEKLRVKFLWMH